MFICPLGLNFFKQKLKFKIMTQYVRNSRGTMIPVSGYTGPRGATGSVPGSVSISASDMPELNNYDVRFSEAYRIAYDLFSSLSDKQWLTKLESIASRSAVGAPSWTDDLGLTQDFQKRRIEAYNSAVAEIQNLINSYYEHVNTLPVTQVQQAADAGVNLAVSGDISGSSMTSAVSSRSQLSGDGTDSTGVITGAVSAVSSVLSTLSSVYKSVQDVKIAREHLNIAKQAQYNDVLKFTSGFWKQLSDSGFDMTNISFNSLQDITSWIDSHHSDPEVQRRAIDSLSKYIQTDLSFTPLRNSMTDENGVFVYDPVKMLYGATGSDSMDHFDDTMKIFADYELQTMLLDKLTAYNTAVYNENKSAVLDGSDAGLAENASNSFTKVNSNLNEIKSQINSEFIQSFADQWHKNKTPEARFALLKMVANMNLDDQSAYELIQLLGSPTLAKGADQVITELVKAGGNIANKLSSFFDRKSKSKHK